MTKNIKKNVNKIYPKEFKQEAIKLALESPYITGTAKRRQHNYKNFPFNLNKRKFYT